MIVFEEAKQLFSEARMNYKKAQTRKYAGAGTFGSYGCKGTTFF